MDAVKINIDKKSMLSIMDGLDKLYPRSRQVNAALLNSLKRAAVPLRAELKKEVPKDQGFLKRSIKIFPSKRNTKQGRPSVFTGPRKEVGDKFPAKYFYILEYGFNPGGGNTEVNGLGLLPIITKKAGPAALSLLEKEILVTLNKRSQKLFGTNIK
tara:strand:- start:143 stop:610 length:468 start_codon:yes stop_codon:yes gene_type:complete